MNDFIFVQHTKSPVTWTTRYTWAIFDRQWIGGYSHNDNSLSYIAAPYTAALWHRILASARKSIVLRNAVPSRQVIRRKQLRFWKNFSSWFGKPNKAFEQTRSRGKSISFIIFSYGGTWFEVRPQYRLNALTEISLLKKRVRKEKKATARTKS